MSEASSNREAWTEDSLCLPLLLFIHKEHAETNYYSWLVAVVIETGLVYTVCLITQFVYFVTHGTGVLIAIAMASQVVVGLPKCLFRTITIKDKSKLIDNSIRHFFPGHRTHSHYCP